eukprot:GFUD01019034.1.p1 GENE.GFUD01019034.1~~GFUD01019034.1.p1  ORF type:complete len:335 (+),score=93.41 GFUD01019034.1:59-1063(+)
MGTEKFCLRWNDFSTNISSAFRELREDKDFFDVTLACDEEQIQAHKVIISACSSFFRNVLRRNQHQHPLLYLKGVKYNELQAILNFMYHGEVNVAQDELNSFLAVAEDLKVKGLTQNQSENDKEKSPKTTSKPPVKKTVSHTLAKETDPHFKRSSLNPPLSYGSPSLIQNKEDEEIQEVVQIKPEPREISSMNINRQTESPGPVSPPPLEDQALATYQEEEPGYEEYQQYEEEGDQHQQYQKRDQTMQIQGVDQEKAGLLDPAELYQYVQHNPEGKGFLCTICQKARPKRAEVRHHVEAIHFPDSFCYQCEHCYKQFRSKNALKVHTTSFHGKL